MLYSIYGVLCTTSFDESFDEETMNFPNFAGKISILAGQTRSNVLYIRDGIFEGTLLTMFAPVTMGADSAKTYLIQVAPQSDSLSGAPVWRTLYDSAGNIVRPPAEGRAQTYVELFSVGAISIVASAAVAAQQDWDLVISAPV